MTNSGLTTGGRDNVACSADGHRSVNTVKIHDATPLPEKP